MYNMVFEWGNYLTTEERKQKKQLDTGKRCCPCSEDVPLFWKINWAAALVHLGNTVATLVLFLVSDHRDATFKLSEKYAPWEPPINGTCAEDGFRVSDDWCIVNKEAVTDELSLWWLIIAFHFLSFVFQTLAMADWRVEFCDKWFERDPYVEEVIFKGTNTLRMIEYSVSATLMQIAIALVLGIYQRLVIIGVAFLTVVTMLFGLIAEKIKFKQLGTAWYAHLSGWVSMGGVWFILGRQFAFTIEKSDTKPPDFVYAIVIIIGVLYTGFALVQTYDLYLKQSSIVNNNEEPPSKKNEEPPSKKNEEPPSKKEDNVKIEMYYCILSLTSKTFLGWIIFANALVGMASNN